MALNFWHAGGRWPSEEALKRQPNAEHLALQRRVAAIIKSDGLAESFDILKSGRKHPELIARLSELSTLLTAHGGSSCNYEKGYSGIQTGLGSTSVPDVVPFADLNASRLKLHGTGHWDVIQLLSDELVMAYREPRCLLANLPLGSHPKMRDSPDEVAKLAKKWDQNGLLRLHDGDRPKGSLVKIFNCYKNLEVDRQIGDRRGQNSYECRVRGPSSDLPCGADIMDLQVDPATQKVVLVISDRKDYYHQLWVTDARSTTNAVGPAVHKELLKDTSAYTAYCMHIATMRRAKREQRGDDLHSFSRHPGECSEVERLPPSCLWVSFASVLQGDHAGVEIATSAHERWLQDYGLLDGSSRLVASRCLRSPSHLQGLVIDDYFSASVESLSTSNADSAAAWCYKRCQQAYSDAQLLGSPEKDEVGGTEGKLVGAYLNSSERARSRGLCTLGAPAMKRVALSFLTLYLCSLSHTTDVLHLCLLGGWVSVLAYRRPLMSVLAKSYQLVDQYNLDHNNPKLVKLPRSVANELVLLAILMPLAIADLSAEYFPKLFATDASSFKGAICWADVPVRVVQALWKTCRCKGSYTRILTPAEVVLRNNGLFDEEKLDQPNRLEVERPFAFEFDFIEVFSGASLVSHVVAQHGFVVGPPLDIGISAEYNLAFNHVMHWLTFMLAEKRLKALLASPPCTTFSIMRRPRLRSAECPFGFDPTDEQTHTGNLLGQRGAQMLYVAAANDAAGILETTYASYLKHLPGWKAVRRLPCSDEVRCDSCAYGSIHQKPFRFLGVNVKMAGLAGKCQCKGPHVKVQGSFTKASATYVPKLVDALALTFVEAIKSVCAKRTEELDVDIAGLENQLVNEVALTSPWTVHSSWKFKKQSHIKILEEASILRLVNFLGRLRKPVRAVALVDSYVVRGATAKGRSSSKALSTILRRVGSSCIAFGVYLTLPFVPTRWNPSDDPTRDVELRGQVDGLQLEGWEEDDLYSLAELPKTKKWASLWMRFVLRMIGPACLKFADRSIYRQSKISSLQSQGFKSMQFEFDASLGFPGEGPSLDFLQSLYSPSLFGFCHNLYPAISQFFRFLTASVTLHAISLTTWIAAGWGRVLCCFRRACSLWLWIFVLFVCLGAPCAEAMPMFPRTAGERSKAAQRSSRPPVPIGRPVLPATQAKRKQLLDEFIIWAIEQGLDIYLMFEQHHIYIDDLNLVLEKYGRAMYECGKTYGKYAETLNAVTSWKPAIRRMLQGAWDYGYAWCRHEPSIHHSAMPGPVALAIVSTGILWGWTRFAAAIAVMWAGLLRPGELLAATRGDLLLPSDGDCTLPFGLLSVRDPKTRYTSARHQSAKIDMPDMLKIAELFYGPLKAHQRPWPYSGSTLRNRFHQVLAALKLPLEPYNGLRPLELASIRAGAATWIISMLESGDLLQRRGRWANRRMMDIYVQEEKLSESAVSQLHTLTVDKPRPPALSEGREIGEITRA
eukprot:s1616_g21.t1